MRRSGGIVALAPVVVELYRVVAGVAQVSRGDDQAAAELAIQRLRQDLKGLEAQRGQVNAERPPSLVFGIAALAVAVTLFNAYTGFAVLSLIVGLVLIAANVVQSNDKSKRKGALEDAIRDVKRQMAYYELKLRV